VPSGARGRATCWRSIIVNPAAPSVVVMSVRDGVAAVPGRQAWGELVVQEQP